MKQLRRDTVRQLQADRRLKGKCCHCDEVFPLADALLFYADKAQPPQVKQIILNKKEELAERRRELKDRRIRARQTAERITVDVNIGKILEKLAPALDGFGYKPRDCPVRCSIRSTTSCFRDCLKVAKLIPWSSWT